MSQPPRLNTPEQRSVDKSISAKPQFSSSSNVVDSGLVEDIDDDIDEPSAEQHHHSTTSEMDDLQRRFTAISSIDGSSMSLKNISADVDSGLCVDATDSELIDKVGSTSSSTPLENDDEELWKLCYTPDLNGDTQLHAAILGNSESSSLARAIANIIRLAPESHWLDMRNDVGQCGMHVAAKTKQPDVVWQLRVAGAKSSIRDVCGNTPLHMACIRNDLACIRALTYPMETREWNNLDHKQRIGILPADTGIRNYNGECCVHIASENGNLDILRHLVHSCGADLNVREGRSGYTALHIACQQKNSLLLEFLLSECLAQLQLETQTYGRLTAYQMAAQRADKSAMEALRRSGAVTREVSSDESEDDSETDDSL